MRLFVALNLPTAERKRLHKAARPLRDSELPIRWLEPDAYHLTLKFLGEVLPENAARVQAAARAIAAKTSRFPVEIEGFGAFPSVRRPRVIWAGVHALPELRALKHDLEWELASLGFERELRAFHPHITIGRTATDSRAGEFRALESLAADLHYESQVQPTTVDLMQSRLSPAGASYTVVAKMSLGELSGARK
ncbi:MAG: RNA 2',3'-cyclic phosphodiesterase [Longimicrobiales bacterium]